MTFSVGSSSVKKGESLLDTVQTIEAMGIDAMVVRHAAAGAPHRVADWIDAAVINAGDGRHEHPTQALLDAFTLRRHRGDRHSTARIAIVGDIRNSRVARSDVAVLVARSAREVTLVGPPTLLPERLDGWPVTVDDRPRRRARRARRRLPAAHPARAASAQALFPTLREYYARWGLTEARAAALKPDALVMHPGPMNRGSEIAAEVADGPRSLVSEQVANGVAVRMAVLWASARIGRPVDLTSAADPGRDASSTRPASARADVLVRDGLIVEVGAGPRRDRAPTVLDAEGASSRPGLVDLQVHFREPGREEAETIETGARAAALGGFTAVVAMPNTTPPLDDAAGRGRGARAGPRTPRVT